MVRSLRWMTVSALLGCLIVAAPVAAQNRTEYVQDEALLFSKEAKAKANAEIAQIWTHFKKELVIDTVDTVKVPDIDEWAIKRAAREKVDGIFVVIVRDPRTIRVELGNHTRESGQFSEADRVELRKQLIANMTAVSADAKDQAKKDHVLLAATAFVHSHMQPATGQVVKHQQQAPPVQHPVQHGQAAGTPLLTYVIIGIGVFLVIWLIMGVLRGIGGGAGSPGMAGGGGGGGGGFFSSMLGGLFGAAAGMWMYNNFFGGHSNSAWGAGPDGGNGPNSGSTDNNADTSYSGDGGDYGNDGGDQGGGDAGGGDAGGGGGDWGGGGGGDWGGGGGGDFGGGGGGGDW